MQADPGSKTQESTHAKHRQPDLGSYAEALARAYVDGAKTAGHEVRLFRLRDLRFDPILHGAFKTPPL